MSTEETNLIDECLKAIAKMTQEKFEGLKLILKKLTGGGENKWLKERQNIKEKQANIQNI